MKNPQLSQLLRMPFTDLQYVLVLNTLKTRHLYCFMKYIESCHCKMLFLSYANNNVADQINLSRVLGKPAFCICENKDADQLRGNREADQRLCFRYMDSTIPLLHKSEISSL